MRQFLINSFSSNESHFQFINYERHRYTYNLEHQEIMHSHKYTEVFFVTDGSGYFKTSDRTYEIKKGTVVINNANVLHTEIPFKNSQLEYALFSVENLSLFERKNDVRNTFVLDFFEDFNTLFNFIRNIEYEWVIRDEYWNFALLNQLESMLLYILRNAKLFPKNLPSPERPHSLAEVYLYLTAHYAEEINLEKICKIFNVNKYTLMHTFKNEYGGSIINTLNKIRCQTAESALKETDKSVTDICLQVGYNSESYFCKMYKKIIGMTPSETRKK